MIVYLSDYLSQYIPSLRVVSYLTFRAVMSLFTALAISLFWGPYVKLQGSSLVVGKSIHVPMVDDALLDKCIKAWYLHMLVF